MKSHLRMSRQRSTAVIRQLTVFRFSRIRPNAVVFSRSLTVRRLVNIGEVIVSQRPFTGSIAAPSIRYQFVNAVTGVPITNFVTVTGTRTAILPFRIPPGTVKLKITNVGSGSAAVQGVILVF